MHNCFIYCIKQRRAEDSNTKAICLKSLHFETQSKGVECLTRFHLIIPSLNSFQTLPHKCDMTIPSACTRPTSKAS